MKNLVFSIVSVLLLTNCSNSSKKSDEKNNTREFVPEPDKEERLKYEAEQKLKTKKMKIKLTFKYSIAFLSLTFIMSELHEIVHTSVGRIICGAWGKRDFNAWELAESCDGNPLAWLSTFAGPFFTFIMVWVGGFLLKSNNSIQQKSLGFSLIFANTPFARLLNPVMSCGDEQNLVYMLIPNINITNIVTFSILFIIVMYPLYLAYKIIENKRFLYFLLFFIVPTFIIILVILVVLNTILANGILATTGILGSPIIVNVWTLFVVAIFIIFKKHIYELALTEKSIN